MIYRALSIIFILFFLYSNAYSSKLYIYLNIEKKLAKPYSLFIKNIAFINKKNRIKFFKINKKFKSSADFGQKFIKKINLKQGIYKRVIIETSNKKIEIDTNLKIHNHSKSIYLVWNVTASIKNNTFAPSIYLQYQQIPLRGEMLFVTSKKDNILFFIRVDQNRVCSVMDIKGMPVEFVLSCINDKIIILCEKSKDIKIVEVTTFKNSDNFILPYVLQPNLITQGVNSLIIGDTQNNRIITINSTNGSLENSKEIGEKISDIVYWQNENKIIVASYNEQQIYILDENLQVLKNIKLSCNPDSMNILDNSLFISETSCNILEKIDLKAIDIKKVYRIISPYRMIFFNSTIYIGNYFQPYLNIIYNNQSFSGKTLRLSIIPDRLALCKRRGWLYISSKNNNLLEVVDLFGEKPSGIIELGARPYDIKVGRSSELCR